MYSKLLSTVPRTVSEGNECKRNTTASEIVPARKEPGHSPKAAKPEGPSRTHLNKPAYRTKILYCRCGLKSITLPCSHSQVQSGYIDDPPSLNAPISLPANKQSGYTDDPHSPNAPISLPANRFRSLKATFSKMFVTPSFSSFISQTSKTTSSTHPLTQKAESQSILKSSCTETHTKIKEEKYFQSLAGPRSLVSARTKSFHSNAVQSLSTFLRSRQVSPDDKEEFIDGNDSFESLYLTQKCSTEAFQTHDDPRINNSTNLPVCSDRGNKALKDILPSSPKLFFPSCHQRKSTGRFKIDRHVSFQIPDHTEASVPSKKSVQENGSPFEEEDTIHTHGSVNISRKGYPLKCTQVKSRALPRAQAFILKKNSNSFSTNLIQIFSGPVLMVDITDDRNGDENQFIALIEEDKEYLLNENKEIRSDSVEYLTDDSSYEDDCSQELVEPVHYGSNWRFWKSTFKHPVYRGAPQADDRWDDSMDMLNRESSCLQELSKKEEYFNNKKTSGHGPKFMRRVMNKLLRRK